MDLVKRVIGIILVATVIVVAVVLVVNLIKSRVVGKGQTASPSSQPVVLVETPPTGGEQPSTPGGTAVKTFNVLGVDVKYPANWSVLSCSNSANFEFDPYGGADSRVVCDRALKSVTILVNSSAICRGVETNIGNLVVRKYRMENPRGVDYQWCFSTKGVNFNITHRVSANGERGTSKGDFSSQIEQMIVQW